MTVEEMKAEANRKQAEKVGCDPEKWAKMSFIDRAEFCRKAKESKAKAAAEAK